MYVTHGMNWDRTNSSAQHRSGSSTSNALRYRENYHLLYLAVNTQWSKYCKQCYIRQMTWWFFQADDDMLQPATAAAACGADEDVFLAWWEAWWDIVGEILWIAWAGWTTMAKDDDHHSSTVCMSQNSHGHFVAEQSSYMHSPTLVQDNVKLHASYWMVVHAGKGQCQTNPYSSPQNVTYTHCAWIQLKHC